MAYFCTALVLLLLPFALGGAAVASDVPEARVAKLSRGVNLSHWYAQSFRGYGEEHLASYITADDARKIADMGFRHVRLTLHPDVVFDLDAGGAAKADAIDRLRARIGWFTDAGLAVVVDLHPTGDDKKPLQSAEGADAFVAGWRALAERLRGLDPQWVFFEVLNEPEPLHGAAWRELQGRTLAAIREVAPEHTVIVNAGGWSGVKDLVAFEPYEDRNVVYTVHWYDPHLFTHQSASWAWKVAERVAQLPWPIEPERAEAVAAEAGGDEESRRHLRWQIADGAFTEARLAEQLEPLVAWQQRHGVPIYVGEFGVFRKAAPPDARLRWHRAAREAFEARGWGWAIWDYAGGFSVVDVVDGARVADAALLEALGLR